MKWLREHWMLLLVGLAVVCTLLTAVLEGMQAMDAEPEERELFLAWKRATGSGISFTQWQKLKDNGMLPNTPLK